MSETDLWTIGFTGARVGLTDGQRTAIYDRLKFTGAHEFRHGDCVGADEQTAALAASVGLTVVAHPPSDGRLRAFTHPDRTEPALPYLERNRAIVDASTELWAAPAVMVEERRSGTWSTVRYARRQGLRVTVFWPDGTVTHQQGDNHG